MKTKSRDKKTAQTPYYVIIDLYDPYLASNRNILLHEKSIYL